MVKKQKVAPRKMEKKVRQHYSAEYKREAVALANKVGTTKACEELGSLEVKEWLIWCPLLVGKISSSFQYTFLIYYKQHSNQETLYVS